MDQFSIGFVDILDICKTGAKQFLGSDQFLNTWM
jgi:hypothetical protein